jgi:hypothetical protein
MPSSSTITVTGDLGVTFTQVGTYFRSNNKSISLWKGTTSSSGLFTATVTPSTTVSMSITVLEYQTVGALQGYSGNSGTGVGFTTGTITVGSSNIIIVAATNSVGGFNPGTGFSIRDTNNGSGVGPAQMVQDKEGVSSNTDADGSNSSSASWITIGAAFGSAAATPDSPTTRQMSQRFDPLPEVPEPSWRQVRLWNTPVSGPVPDNPSTHQPGQRRDPLPEFDFRWYQQVRHQPSPLTYLPPPPLINPPHSQVRLPGRSLRVFGGNSFAGCPCRCPSHPGTLA